MNLAAVTYLEKSWAKTLPVLSVQTIGGRIVNTLGFFCVPVQYCMAHLIGEIRFLAEYSIKKLSRWGNELLE